MTDKNIKGNYWSGSAVGSAVSNYLTENVTAPKGYYSKFVSSVRDKFTSERVELEQKLGQNTMEDPNRTTILAGNLNDVDSEGSEIEELQVETGENELDVYKAKYKECMVREKYAVKMIENLKDEVNKTEQEKQDLAKEASTRTAAVMEQALNTFSVEKAEAEKKAQVENNARLKLAQDVRKFPPPTFKGKGASCLLAFLNEEFEEYCTDLGMTNKKDQLRFLPKIFGDSIANTQLKKTTARFFKRAEIETMVTGPGKIQQVYQELISFIFAVRPEKNMEKRSKNESLANFFYNWFTIKEYGGENPSKIGVEIFEEVFKNPNTINVKPEVMTEIRKQFYVKQLIGQHIEKEEVLGYMEHLDLIFASKNATEGSAASTATEESETPMKAAGLVALEKSENTGLEKAIKELTHMLEKSKVENKSGQNSGTWTGNKNGQRGSWAQKNYQKNNYRNQGYGRNSYKQSKPQVDIRDYSNRQFVRTFNINMAKVAIEVDAQGESNEYVFTEVVPGKTEKSLLDTGANKNGICSSLLTEHGMSDQIDTDRKGKVTVANNAEFETNGVIKIEIVIEGEPYEVEFHVIKDLVPRVILGTPFMQDTGIYKDFVASIQSRLMAKKSKN